MKLFFVFIFFIINISVLHSQGLASIDLNTHKKEKTSNVTANDLDIVQRTLLNTFHTNRTIFAQRLLSDSYKKNILDSQLAILPTVTYNAESGFTKNNFSFSGGNGGITSTNSQSDSWVIQQNLFNPTDLANVKSNTLLYEKSLIDLENTISQTLLASIQSLIDIYKFKTILKTALNQEEIARVELANSQEKYDSKSISYSEYLLQQAEYQNKVADTQSAQINLNQAKNKYFLITGLTSNQIPESFTLEEIISPHIPRHTQPINLRNIISNNNLNILSNKTNIKQLSANSFAITIGNAAPSITLNYTSTSGYFFFQQNTINKSFSVNIKIPIFYGGRNIVKSLASKQYISSLNINHDHMVLETQLELENQIQQVKLNDTMIGALKRTISAREKSIERMKLELEMNKIDYIDLLNERDKLFDAKRKIITQQANRITSNYQISLLSGELYAFLRDNYNLPRLQLK